MTALLLPAVCGTWVETCIAPANDTVHGWRAYDRKKQVELLAAEKKRGSF